MCHFRLGKPGRLLFLWGLASSKKMLSCPKDQRYDLCCSRSIMICKCTRILQSTSRTKIAPRFDLIPFPQGHRQRQYSSRRQLFVKWQWFKRAQFKVATYSLFQVQISGVKLETLPKQIDYYCNDQKNNLTMKYRKNSGDWSRCISSEEVSSFIVVSG